MQTKSYKLSFLQKMVEKGLGVSIHAKDIGLVILFAEFSFCKQKDSTFRDNEMEYDHF